MAPLTYDASSTATNPSTARETRRLIAYLLVLFTLAAVPTAWLVAVARASGMPGWHIVLMGLVTVIAMSEPAQHLMHFALRHLVRRRRLATLDFETGIPNECRTAVVVPALLIDHQATFQLLASLERHFLSDRDANLRFVLLTDFMDATAEVTSSDSGLLEQAERSIADLNRMHAGADGDMFFLMHRPRLWAPRQGAWMGRERKRGKLMDFNAFVLHGRLDPFTRVAGDLRRLEGIRFVITLDADTGLPAHAAQRMVSAMAHPSNHPVHDPVTGVVVSGYGMMQPRMVTRLDVGVASWRQRMACGVIPPRPQRGPPVNAEQRLFGTTAFFGKGIYDVAAFERALAQRLPDDWILSHDLLEGCFARCTALPDVELTETVPGNLLAELNRRHRWIRGDWQSVPWASLRVPLGGGRWEINPLSMLSRWRVLDNMRRTVWPGSMVVLLLVCVAGLGAWWPAAVLTCIAFFLPVAVEDLLGLLRKDCMLPLHRHLAYWLRCFGLHLYHAASAVMLLPVDAVVAAGAIATALWRMLWSRYKMLAWVASDRSQQITRSGLANHIKAMVAGPAAAFLVLVLAGGTESTWAAATLAVLWTASPLVAWALGRPIKSTDPARRVTGHSGRFEIPK